MRVTLHLFLVNLFVLFASAVLSAQTVKESDLLTAKKGGASDAQIIKLIQMVKRVDVDLSFGNLQTLKDKGISDQVIQALSDRKDELEKNTDKAVNKSNVSDPEPIASSATIEKTAKGDACPADDGVHIRTSAGWKQIEPLNPQPEIAKGAMKSVLTGGLKKASNKWDFPGAHAPVRVAGPDIELCVRDGRASLRNVTLAVLASHKDKREVEYSSLRPATGQTGGRNDKNFRPVNASKSPDGAIIVKLTGIETGEYALDLIGMPQYDFSVTAQGSNK